MYLLIDAGNTRVKWLLVDAVYDPKEAALCGCLEEFSAYLKDLDRNGVKVLLAAVNEANRLLGILYGAGFKQVEVVTSKAEQFGLVNSYGQPERMGVDRWLAMLAAYAAVNKDGTEGVVVIDAGSALTVDVVDIKGTHLGGYIVPGIKMAQQALFSNTDRVTPCQDRDKAIELETPFNKLGKNTLQCVEYGVINQQVALVKMVVDRYPGYDLMFTGGDGELIAKYFAESIVDKNLVLKGLWQVRN